MTATAAPQLVELPLADLAPHPHNPRKAVSVSAADPLVASVKAQGVLEPLIAAPAPDGVKIRGKAKWLLLAGHRRLAAARLAKRRTVPVIIREDLATVVAQVEAMLVENIHRQDLSPVEEGDAYQLILDLEGLTQADLANQVGQPRGRIRERLKLAAAPEPVRERIHAGQISIEHALVLIRLQEHPDLSEKVTKALGTSNEQWELANATKRLEARAKAAKVLAACQRDEGMTEVTEAPWNALADGGLAYPGSGRKYDGDPVADHSPNGPCPDRAYRVYRDHGSTAVGAVSFVCGKPEQHFVTADGAPAAGHVDPVPHEPTAEELADQEAREKLLVAQAVRLQHVRAAILNPPAGAAATLALAATRDPASPYRIEDWSGFGDMPNEVKGYWAHVRTAARLLFGMDPNAESEDIDGDVEKAWAQLRRWSVESLAVYGWFASAVELEEQLVRPRQITTAPTEDLVRYCDALTSVLGYEWSLVEQELLGLTSTGAFVLEVPEGGADDE